MESSTKDTLSKRLSAAPHGKRLDAERPRGEDVLIAAQHQQN